ncbi:MAG: hypothetical protein GY947_10915 [Rhodobacteraceae bacterium]|nr:hypothetical protein [Paracoccaceae bacterium]
MRIKRLRITLPAHLKDTAHHDARAIAEAVGQALSGHSQDTGPATVNLQGHGQSGAVLASQVGSQLSKGGRNGG